MRLLSRFIFWITGWKVVSQPPKGIPKSVMIAAPHTSNWDFIFSRAAFYIMKLDVKFLIKKSWFFFPMNIFFKSIGGIPIDRSKKGKTVDYMVDIIKKTKKIIIMIPPEGTRKYVEKWKTGFYHTAVKANVPILMGFLDYAKKHAGVMGPFYPTGDLTADMIAIRSYYKDVTAKYPDQHNYLK